MAYIWKYVKSYKGLLILAILGNLGFVLVTLGLPTMLARMIDEGILVDNADIIWRYFFFMVGLALIGLVGRLLTIYTSSKIVNSMTMEMRNDAYRKMHQLSHHEFQELGVPSLTTRISSDAFILLQFTDMIIRQGFTAPMMIIVSVIMIISTSIRLGLTILPLAPIIFITVLLIARITLPISERQQNFLDRINRVLRESITGLRVIRAFNREECQEHRFAKANNAYRQESTTLFRWMAVTPALFSIIVNLAIIAIIWFGSGYIENQTMQVGTIVAFIEYVFHALFSLMLFANIFMIYPRAQVSAERLEEVLETPISVQEKPETEQQNDSEEYGTLEFRDVDFAYPDADKPVLQHINFKTKPGDTIAFIGSTGSGKSTIVKLIPRFYDVSKGQILVDGIDVRDYGLDKLRQKIGYTPQKALLFTGDIDENLRFGKFDASKEDLEHATMISQAQEFIHRLENHYQTHIAEGGNNLSGGQKQRLSIARSILGGREIYIFDDSFSALDYKTDAALRKALKDETKDATTVIVAQRVGTIMHADQIIVLDEGHVAAKGTHEELLKNSPLYYEIAASQLSEEELQQ